ncbi:hypothetical protein K1719_008301 [Acacia pycnantha]|nr:hypothetical protein K1719_008301 [Acacia pycnantha]
MNKICGEPISSREVSASKAARILSNFISAENGASNVISAYLHQSSASLNELNRLHKGSKLLQSNQKHKGHKIK